MSGAYPVEAKEHLAIAERKLDEMRARARHPPGRLWTLDRMVEAWRELAVRIEQGYDEMVEEYWNDLSVRDLLDELLAVIPEGPVRSSVAADIDDADRRYRRATHEVEEPIFGSGEVGWWWRRVPNVLVGELRRGLAVDG